LAQLLGKRSENAKPAQLVDVPPFIQLLGINNTGTIVGYTGFGVPMSADPNNGFINGVTHGFVDNGNGPTATAVDIPGVMNANPAVNQLLGLNQVGNEAAGFYTDNNGVSHAYTYLVTPMSFTLLNIPASLGFSAGDSSMATGVNNSGMATGFFMMGANSVGFLFNGTNTYTPISPPGSTSTQPLSLNDLGDVVGTYVGQDGLNHGFFFNGKTYTTIDGVAGAPMNLVQGVNDFSGMVGFAVINANTTQTVGFTSTLPEPSTFVLTGFAIFGALAIRYRKFAR
jgi:hypothetical protein